MPTTVLVTGVSTYLGAGVARALAASEGVERVVGVDVMAPEFPLGEAEFLRSDARNPLLGRVVRQAGIDTLVHVPEPSAATGRSARVAAREAMVIGTMQLLGVCQAVPQLRHVVLASTGSVYGSSSSSPAVVTEQTPTTTLARGGHVRDAIEVESYVRAVARRRSDVGISILRLTHLFGRHSHSAMTNYLRAPVVPVPLGFDARIQALHEDDAVDVLVAAASGEPVDTVNVAGDGVVTLRQLLRLAHRPSVPVLTTTGRALGRLARWAGIAGVEPDHIDYVMFGRCLDTSRMRDVLGFVPRMTTRETVQWYARETWGVVPSPPASDLARPETPRLTVVPDLPRREEGR